jgi:3-methylfumaryl-CoA hydratase
MTEPDEWRDWIGRRFTSTARLDPWLANHLAVTLDREPDLADGDELPPAWHWIFFHDLVRTSELGREGHPKPGIVMPPVGLPRRMWAGGTLEVQEPLVLGSTVERVSTIRDIVAKQGRSGPLVFVTVEHEIRTGATRNLREEQRIVYRDASDATDRSEPPQTDGADRTVDDGDFSAEPDADFSAQHDLDPATLFRYSALTFNAHRIHYDADYCRDVEGYPAVVVHGPLIATLLLDLCVRNQRSVGRFTYRAEAPLFLPGGFTAHGATTGDATRLWATDRHGRIAMEAEARPA